MTQVYSTYTFVPSLGQMAWPWALCSSDWDGGKWSRWKMSCKQSWKETGLYAGTVKGFCVENESIALELIQRRAGCYRLKRVGWKLKKKWARELTILTFTGGVTINFLNFWINIYTYDPTRLIWGTLLIESTYIIIKWFQNEISSL